MSWYIPVTGTRQTIEREVADAKLTGEADTESHAEQLHVAKQMAEKGLSNYLQDSRVSDVNVYLSGHDYSDTSGKLYTHCQTGISVTRE